MSSKRFTALCIGGLWITGTLLASGKLTEDDRIAILRGLTAEYATVKAYLPRSKKPLPFSSDGTWDKKTWEDMGRPLGPAARTGDLVQITSVKIEDDKILLTINNGFSSGGHWYDHVQVGMGTTTQPISNQNSSAATGTYIALLFKGGVGPVTADQIKKMLSPVLDFSQHSATENYVEKLPAPVQKAIKENKAIVGMDREQVLLALGKPRHKERSETADGAETEDWVFGEPPGKITFVTFNGSKVVRVDEAYADVGGSTAAPLPAN